MPLSIPDTLYDLVRPLFRALPLDRAMTQLVVDPATSSVAREHVAMVGELIASEPIRSRPDLIAGLWLYVDELDRSHAASQSLDTPTGSFWHAIMHRREGDFSNAKYWYRRTGKHPAMNRISLAGGSAGSGTEIGGYDPMEFVDRVQRAHARHKAHPELVAIQHREWRALFEFCAKQDE